MCTHRLALREAIFTANLIPCYAEIYEDCYRGGEVQVYTIRHRVDFSSISGKVLEDGPGDNVRPDY